MVLGFTGDLFLGSKANLNAFAEIARGLPAGTNLVINFEGTLYRLPTDLEPARRKILLDSPVDLTSMLDPLPVVLASVGNNHIADYGNGVAAHTLEHLRSRFPAFGAGLEHEDFHTCVQNIGGVRLGFANYCTADTTPLFCSPTRIGPRPLSIGRARADVVRLAREADHCVALIHWGVEYYHHPRPALIRLGRQLIDAGFKLVIGHHSHSAQGYEEYKGSWIFYSLGNFHFPDHTIYLDGQRFRTQWMPRRSWGVLPLFNVNKDEIALKEVKLTQQPRNGATRFTDASSLQRRIRRVSHALTVRPYSRYYHRTCRWEALRIRYEEFCNNEHKVRAVIRKAGRFLGIA
jgi:hypothetical protein